MESCLRCSEENGEKTESGIMKLPAYYRCPAGHSIATIQDALDDAPDEIRQPAKTLFSHCWSCEKAVYEPVIKGPVLGVVGYCMLRCEVRV